MNTFYYIKNMTIETAVTIQDKIYMENFLKCTMYDSIEEIPIQEGYEISGTNIIPTISKLKEMKYLEIKNDFANYEKNGIEGGIESITLGIQIQCAKPDIEKIQAIVNAQTLGVAIPTYYKGVDGIISDVTPTDFQNVYKELHGKYMQQWKLKQTRYLQLKAAATREEIEAI